MTQVDKKNVVNNRWKATGIGHKQLLNSKERNNNWNSISRVTIGIQYLGLLGQ